MFSDHFVLFLRILFITFLMFHVTQFFMPFAYYFRLSPFARFHSPFSLLHYRVYLSRSRGVLWGTARKRMPLSASSFSRCAPQLIPASDLRIVHPIARLFPRGSHWYQDPDIRITGVPWGLLLPSLHRERGSNRRPLVAIGLEALFYVFTPTFLFLAPGSKSEERKRK